MAGFGMMGNLWGFLHISFFVRTNPKCLLRTHLLSGVSLFSSLDPHHTAATPAPWFFPVFSLCFACSGDLPPGSHVAACLLEFLLEGLLLRGHVHPTGTPATTTFLRLVSLVVRHLGSGNDPPPLAHGL